MNSTQTDASLTRREQMVALKLALTRVGHGVIECEDNAQATRIYNEAKRLAVLMAGRTGELPGVLPR